MLKNVLIAFAIFTVISANEEGLQRFKERNKVFAAATYKQMLIQKRHDNFLVCPLSAEIVLSLAQNGAKGKTRQEIRTALNLPNSTKEINSVIKSLLTNFQNNESYSLHTANKIYVKSNFSIKKQFLKISSEVYQSPLENIDFSDTEVATKTINDWVSKQTGNKINNLIDSKSLREDTAAILVNALYLQAYWRKNFKKSLTRQTDFYKTDEEIIQVDFMKKTDYYGYLESEELDAKFLHIQFRDGRHSGMVIVLPNEKEGLHKLENKIGELYTQEFKWEFVDVSLPKFKIETSVDFKKILKKMGIRKAFTRADFSGMAGERGQIHISDVLQKTYIDVNEYGVEAAAATSVFFHPKSLMEYSGETKTFVADHPFLFYIIIDEIVVFTGRVISPSS